jgi:hypothetical protein
MYLKFLIYINYLSILLILYFNCNINIKNNKIMENPNDKPIIYVGGLDDQVDEKTLHAAFVPFGEIKTIEMPLDHTTGINKK